MALTLVEAAKLTQDLLLRGVVETIVSESQVLAYLPFMDVTGNALTYNQEATLPTAAFMAVGDTWTEDTPTFAQKTAKLAILGGDADVDNFLQQTYSNPNDHPYEVILYSMQAGGDRMDNAKNKLRPWLQDFSYGRGIAYGPNEVRAQIKATYYFDATGWLL